MHFSFLDNGAWPVNHTAHEAMARMAEMALHCDREGFSQFWVGQHVGTPGYISGSPAVLLDRLSFATRNIRLGMGPYYIQFKAVMQAAEDVATLHHLHGDRFAIVPSFRRESSTATAVDMTSLGSGVALSFSDPKREEELQRLMDHLATQDLFPQFPDSALGKGTNVPVYLAGDLPLVAETAARNGLPFAFQGNISITHQANCFELYRSKFQARPNYPIQRPWSILVIPCIIAESEERAKFHFTPHQLKMMDFYAEAEWRDKHRLWQEPVGSLRDDANFNEEIVKELYTRSFCGALLGDVAQVKEKIKALVDTHQIDEFVFCCDTYDQAVRLQTVSSLRVIWDQLVS